MTTPTDINLIRPRAVAPRTRAHALHELQERFQAHLLNPDIDISDLVVSTARVNGAARLKIYAEAYRLRLIEALRTDFPALHALLGDEGFDHLGRAYIDTYPSHHFSIRWFGRHLTHFLTETSPYRERPVLWEVAAFEWALSEAFDGADTALVNHEALAALPAAAWPAMRLRLHPTVRRVDLRYNVPALWKAITEGQTWPTTEAAEHPIGWLIWRPGLKTFFRSLPISEARSLDAVLAGHSFAEICEGLCEWTAEDQVAPQAAGFLQAWMRGGVITAIESK